MDWNLIFGGITALSTLSMMIATIFMAIAAWQAKNSFIKQRGYEDYLKLTELIDNCQDKILFLPVELMDDNYRKNYTEQMTESIKKINLLIKSAQNYLPKIKMKYYLSIYYEILKFHGQLLQEACPYEGLKAAHKEYLNAIIKIKENPIMEKLLFTAIETHNQHYKKSE